MESEAHDRPRLTPKGERTRSRIVEAAARLIHERGVAATTLDDIRSGAGVSGSQLSHYFAGKDELVQAVIDYQAGTITGNQRHADLGSPEGLRSWRDTVIAQVKTGEGKGGCPLGSLAGQVAETDAQAREELWPDYKTMRDRIGKERGWPPMGRDEFVHEADHGSLYVGSPETVARKISATVKTLGLSRFQLKYSA
ncbi:MAG TPA: helix-turn-helix domain-containing protein, partial [Streptosporangiaceae bacterium]|nr:helix-turn-helix domain-containing protein [Streptosporangiaceae bacterium]